MIRCEATFYPTGTIQTVTTDQSEFAHALYEVALQAGEEIEVQVLADGLHQLTFTGEDADVSRLYQAAYACEDELFWAEMKRPQVLASVAA